MKFNSSWDDRDNSRFNKDPQFQRPMYIRDESIDNPDHATPLITPRIQAPYNITYLGFIDLIEYLWIKAHPEIIFTPFADNNVYDPELGYVVYSLVNREPKQNNPKPRYQEAIDNPDNINKKMVIFTQSFINSIRFTAVHKSPRVAEELIEVFEDFMLEHTPIFKRFGLEELQYGRRASDEHKGRFGEDLAARSVIYMVVIQKIVITDINKLEEIWIEIMTRDSVDATPNSVFQPVFIVPPHATPS
jgi:hypothetical protein